jgi:hypothetical protein
MMSNTRAKIQDFDAYVNTGSSDVARAVMFDAHDGALGLSKEEFCVATIGWRASVLEDKNGHPIGAVLDKDGEGHIGILRDNRGKYFSPKFISSTSHALDVTHTILKKSNRKCVRVFERFGWAKIAENKNGVLLCHSVTF